MKMTCRTLSILLLSTLSCVAAQRAGVPGTSARVDTPPVEIFSFSVIQKPPQMADATSGQLRENMAGYNSALPLLSCIAAGMALGGLLSARWCESRDK